MVLPTHKAVLCLSALTTHPSVVTENVLLETAQTVVIPPLELVVPVVLLESLPLPLPQAIINMVVQVMAERRGRERIKIL
jgi:Ni,Fe-hydrogenase III small subunit